MVQMTYSIFTIGNFTGCLVVRGRVVVLGHGSLLCYLFMGGGGVGC
jgi:hypothetical protein